MRHQCHEPMFFEMFGIDIAHARVVVLKSRGHFRAAFDEFFSDAQFAAPYPHGLRLPCLIRHRRSGARSGGGKRQDCRCTLCLLPKYRVEPVLLFKVVDAVEQPPAAVSSPCQISLRDCGVRPRCEQAHRSRL
ncbi:hypothetical protein P3T23_003387 [Paraburkholderia sp. GAS448]|uniref:MlrC C-terminal domain-containing protein n=1 Tax=Paraburkholderia sp. GAS448 TaxID=3035136 RepID=UPI003D1910FA